MPETLAKTFLRWKPANSNGSRLRPVILHPTQYIRQGYKPIKLSECLEELQKRFVLFGVDENGDFWFDQERMSLTPGLLASLYFHFPLTMPEKYRGDNDADDFEPF